MGGGVGDAGEAGVFVLGEETHFALVLAVEGVGVGPGLEEGFAGGEVGGVAFEDTGGFEVADALVEGVDDLVFAGEVVVDDARAGSGALGDERHGSFVEAALDDDVEHGVEDGVSFGRLGFGGHGFILPRRAGLALGFGGNWG